MTLTRHLHRGIPVLRLVGEIGRESVERVGAELYAAFKASEGRVLVDLQQTVHLHYRVAAMIVGAAMCRRKIAVVGPSPYVRQILRFAGAHEAELREHGTFEEALAEVAA